MALKLHREIIPHGSETIVLDMLELKAIPHMTDDYFMP